jgi:hypothetical protein
MIQDKKSKKSGASLGRVAAVAAIGVSPSFGYGSLLEHAQRAGLLANDVQQLFGFFRTSDFELILRLVWQASNEVEEAIHIICEKTSSLGVVQ